MIARGSPIVPQQVKETQSLPVTLPDDLPSEIAPFVPTSLSLIRECFPTARSVSGRMVSDPEIGQTALDLLLELEGSSKEVADALDLYVRRWVTAVPFPQSHSILLSFLII